MSIYLLLFFIFSQYATGQIQHIEIKGRVVDSYDEPVKGANVSAMFINNVLVAAPVDSNGYYTMTCDVYGGLNSVDLITEYQGENIKIVQNMPILQNEVGAYIHVTGCDGIYASFVDARVNLPKLYTPPTKRHRYGVSGIYDPVFYNKKVLYIFEIVDKHKIPIKNARVEIFIADDTGKPRWGITDENGYLVMRMDFENGALDGKIRIAAEGYRKKRLPFQRFNINNYYAYTLKKKRSFTKSPNLENK